jgi:FKBP-type peptidyl-prolyl cis-trans isomerase SlpA
MKKVETNSTVTVNYTGRLEDGSIFDSSVVEGREPLTATLGQGQLIKGFESGLHDMLVGDKKTVEIEAEDAYGAYNDFMVQEVKKEQMPGEVEVGMHLQADTQMGPVQFVVKDIKENSVILDANHPLAGQKLIFDLEVLEIQ